MNFIYFIQFNDINIITSLQELHLNSRNSLIEVMYMDTNKLRNRRFNSQEELIQALKVLFEEDKQEYIRQCGDDTKFRIQDDN